MTDIFDREFALEQAGGSPELAHELFSMLLKELPDLLAKLKQAHSQMNYEAMWDHAHKIRGSTAYCGVPALATAATALEQQIKQRDESHLAAGVEGVCVEVERLVAEGDSILGQLG